MKKRLLALLLVVTISFSALACGNKTEVPEESNTSETSEETRSVEVDENLLTVEITVPADYMENTTQEDLDKVVSENGFISATLNEDGSVGVELPDDFADFQMTYKENRDRLAFLSEDIPEDSLEYEITKKSADDELEYWVERYPAYDAASLCKERKADYTLEDIKEFRKMTSSECEADFFRFQDSYLTPMMNKEIMQRIREK